MRLRNGGAALASPALLLLLFMPAAGWSINTLDYWLMQTAGISKPYACTTESPTNRSSFGRQYAGTANDCPGQSVYHVTKGESGTNLWSTESYYTNNGFLKIIQEVTSYPSNPPADCVNNGFSSSCDLARAFRDAASGWKGVVTVPLTFTSGWTYNHAPYHEETWVTGYRVCSSSNKIRTVNGSGVRVEMYQGPTWPAFLQDRRGTNPTLTWHDVQTIERRDFWGNNGEFEERYWYGRWFNPQTSSWQGVGLVKWEYYHNGVLMNVCGNGTQPCSSLRKYLVDCNAVVPCWSCPP